MVGDTETDSFKTLEQALDMWCFYCFILSLPTAVWVHWEEATLPAGFCRNSRWPINPASSLLSNTQVETQPWFLVIHDLFQPSVIFCYWGLHLITLTRAEVNPRPSVEDVKSQFRQNSEDNSIYTDINPFLSPCNKMRYLHVDVDTDH